MYREDNAEDRVAKAVEEAAKNGRRVLVVFGADWCPDCLALDRMLKEKAVRVVTDRGYVTVYVGTGKFDKNLDVAEKYGVDVTDGIPAAAVLDCNGSTLWKTEDGEWSSARRMESAQLAGIQRCIHSSV